MKRPGGQLHSTSTPFSTSPSNSSPVSTISSFSIAAAVAAAALVLCTQVSSVNGCGYHSTETDSNSKWNDDADLLSVNCTNEGSASVQHSYILPATPPPSPINDDPETEDQPECNNETTIGAGVSRVFNLLSLSLSDNDNDEEYSSVSYDGDLEDNSSTTSNGRLKTNSNTNSNITLLHSTRGTGPGSVSVNAKSVFKPKPKLGTLNTDEFSVSNLYFGSSFDNVEIKESDPAGRGNSHGIKSSNFDPFYREEYELDDGVSVPFSSIGNSFLESSTSSPRKRSASSHTPYPSSIISPDPTRMSKCESILSLTFSIDDNSTVFERLADSSEEKDMGGSNYCQNERVEKDQDQSVYLASSEREKELLSLPPVHLFNLTPDSPVYHGIDEESAKFLLHTKFQYFNQIELYTDKSIHPLCDNFGIFLYRSLIGTAKSTGIDKICNCDDSSKSENLALKLFNQLSFVFWITTGKLYYVSTTSSNETIDQPSSSENPDAEDQRPEVNSRSLSPVEFEHIKCTLDMLVFECILSTIDSEFFNQLQVETLPQYDYFELLKLVRESLLAFVLDKNLLDAAFLNNEKVVSIFRTVIIEADSRLHEESVDIIRRLYNCATLDELRLRFDIKELGILSQVKDVKNGLSSENLHMDNQLRKKKKKKLSKTPTPHQNSFNHLFTRVWQNRVYILLAVLLAVFIQTFFISPSK